MNKKQLVELGVPEDVAEQVVILNGKDIETVKGRYEPLEAQVTTLQEQLDAATKAVEGFKAMDVDGIKAAADQYKAEAERVKQEAEDTIFQMEFENALNETLLGAGARNPRTVMALLDYDKLDVDEQGNITGLAEQLTQVAEDNPFLFEPADGEPRIVMGGQNHTVISDATVDAARKAAGLPPKKE